MDGEEAEEAAPGLSSQGLAQLLEDAEGLELSWLAEAEELSSEEALRRAEAEARTARAEAVEARAETAAMETAVAAGTAAAEGTAAAQAEERLRHEAEVRAAVPAPRVLEATTPRVRGCNPTHERLHPHVLEPATSCTSGPRAVAAAAGCGA